MILKTTPHLGAKAQYIDIKSDSNSMHFDGSSSTTKFSTSILVGQIYAALDMN